MSVIGTPCSGPSFLPAFTARSAALACLRAPSTSIAMIALSSGLWRRDALEIEIEQLEAADLLLPDGRGELLGGLERQGIGHGMAVAYCAARREETPRPWMRFALPLGTSFFMTFLVSGVATWRALGAGPGVFWTWMASWIIAWAIAFPDHAGDDAAGAALAGLPHRDGAGLRFTRAVGSATSGSSGQ